MPDTSPSRPLQPPAGSVYSSTTLELRAARTAGHITQEEYRQYRDWYLGLAMLNGHTDNLIARQLWAGLWLPLGTEKQELHTRLCLPHTEELKL